MLVQVFKGSEIVDTLRIPYIEGIYSMSDSNQNILLGMSVLAENFEEGYMVKATEKGAGAIYTSQDCNWTHIELSLISEERNRCLYVLGILKNRYYENQDVTKNQSMCRLILTEEKQLKYFLINKINSVGGLYNGK